MYTIPINVTKKNSYNDKSWDYFENITDLREGKKETFIYSNGMKKGDLVFLYLTNNGLKNSKYKKEKGIYAIGKIVSDSEFLLEDKDDHNYNPEKNIYVIEVEFIRCEENVINLCEYFYAENNAESRPFSIKEKILKNKE